MKKFLMSVMIIALLVSCASTESPIIDGSAAIESVYIKDTDDIRTTISVGGRLCTLRLSAVTGEKFIMVEEGRRYRTYQLTELPPDKDGKRYLYSTAGNLNIILDGHHIYISLETEWTETYIERDYLSPFVFATHA